MLIVLWCGGGTPSYSHLTICGQSGVCHDWHFPATHSYVSICGALCQVCVCVRSLYVELCVKTPGSPVFYWGNYIFAWVLILSPEGLIPNNCAKLCTVCVKQMSRMYQDFVASLSSLYQPVSTYPICMYHLCQALIIIESSLVQPVSCLGWPVSGLFQNILILIQPESSLC